MNQYLLFFLCFIFISCPHDPYHEVDELKVLIPEEFFVKGASIFDQTLIVLGSRKNKSGYSNSDAIIYHSSTKLISTYSDFISKTSITNIENKKEYYLNDAFIHNSIIFYFTKGGWLFRLNREGKLLDKIKMNLPDNLEMVEHSSTVIGSEIMTFFKNDTEHFLGTFDLLTNESHLISVDNIYKLKEKYLPSENLFKVFEENGVLKIWVHNQGIKTLNSSKTQIIKTKKILEEIEWYIDSTFIWHPSKQIVSWDLYEKSLYRPKMIRKDSNAYYFTFTSSKKPPFIAKISLGDHENVHWDTIHYATNAEFYADQKNFYYLKLSKEDSLYVKALNWDEITLKMHRNYKPVPDNNLKGIEHFTIIETF